MVRGAGGRFLVAVFAVDAIFDDEADGFFDADPVVLLCYCCRCFVDAAVRQGVDLTGDFVLALWVCDDFFVFEHQPFFAVLAVLGGEEFVMGCGAAESGFFSPVGAVGIFAVFEVEADFVEAFF